MTWCLVPVLLKVIDERSGAFQVAPRYGHTNISSPKTATHYGEIVQRGRYPDSFQQRLQEQRLCVVAVVDDYWGII